MNEIAGEYVDRLVCTEMRTPTFGAFRGLTMRLYEAARAAQGGPLTQLAAQALCDRLKAGDFVFILTGTGALPWRPHGETDGPLGAASLARALAKGLGARPVYISHERYLPPIISASEAAGISVLSREMVEYGYWLSAIALPFPLGLEAAESAAARLLEEYKPAAVISIEKLGPNHKGVVHGVTGLQRPAQNEALTDSIVNLARRRGILTIGIGDGGNELGYGKILQSVREIHPYGERCQCACEGGIACVTETDVLVHGAVSNWAGYGVAACLALTCREKGLLHDPQTEARMLQACADAGAEGGPGYRQPWVDNIPLDVHVAMVTMLHGIVDQALKESSRVPRPW